MNHFHHLIIAVTPVSEMSNTVTASDIVFIVLFFCLIRPDTAASVEEECAGDRGQWVWQNIPAENHLRLVET